MTVVALRETPRRDTRQAAHGARAAVRVRPLRRAGLVCARKMVGRLVVRSGAAVPVPAVRPLSRRRADDVCRLANRYVTITVRS